MSTYKDISEAFDGYCSVVRFSERLAHLLFEKLKKKGKIPDGYLSFCSPTAEVAQPEGDGDQNPIIRKAIEHDPGSQGWLIGFLLTVETSNGFWGREFLRFNVNVRPGNPRYSVQLWHSDVCASFLPKEKEECPETDAAIDEFAQGVIDKVVAFYREAKERSKDGGERVIQGFSRLRSDQVEGQDQNQD